MIVVLNERFDVEIDSYNHTLVEKSIGIRGKSKGKETRISIGYFGNMEQVLKRILKLEAASVENTLKFKEYLDYLEDQNSKLDDTINNVVIKLKSKVEKKK